MTTIAYDGKHIAADTAHWAGDVLGWLQDKLHVIQNEYETIAVFGAAGDYTQGLNLSEWLPKLLYGEKLDPRPENEDWQALVIDLRTGHPYVLETSMILAPCVEPMAIGAGHVTAMAAMRSGKNAVQAVQLCCDTTPYTSGPITSYNVKKKRYELEL